MIELALVLVVLCAGALVFSARRTKAREIAKAQEAAAELEPVRRLVDEDVTALGVELQELDLDMSGHQLDRGANADYQRALDAYEAAKVAAHRVSAPDEVKHVTEILEDGRYAMECVRARVEGRPLPARRPPCFFDARHGLSVDDISWTPPGGVPRDVPACALDLERVRVGAEPDVRKVMVGSRRVPYWQGGRAYEPYAAGYYGAFAPMQWMFVGMLFWGGLPGLGGGVDPAGALGSGDSGDSGDGGGSTSGDGSHGAGDHGSGDVGGGGSSDWGISDGGSFDFGGDFGGFDF